MEKGPMGKSLPLPSREQTVAIQVNTLLSATSTLTGLLHYATSDGDGAKDGGVKSSVEASLITVCARLDALVSNDECWGMDTQNKLENQLAAVYAEHLSLLKLQSAAVAKMDLPHRRCAPTLMRMDDGNWVAFLGLLSDLNKSIVGVGKTPEAALAAFDDVFIGKQQQQNETLTVEEIPHDENLDSGTKPGADSPETRRDSGEGNSGDAGPDPGAS